MNFFKQFRMDPCQMEEVLKWVAPKIYKRETRADVIGPAERLCVTMRYLATGDAFFYNFNELQDRTNDYFQNCCRDNQCNLGSYDGKGLFACANE